MAEILGRDNINKLNSKDVFDLLADRYGWFKTPSDELQIAKILGKDNINKLSDYDISSLLFDCKNHKYDSFFHRKDQENQTANIIVKYKSEFSNAVSSRLLIAATDKQQMAKLLGADNIKKLDADDVRYLLSCATDKQQMADIIGKDNINKLSGSNICDLLLDATDKQQMAKILGANNINKLDAKKISYLLNKEYKQTFL
jgi:hypothetical protein